MRGLLVVLIALASGCDVVFNLDGRVEPDALVDANDAPDGAAVCPEEGYVPVPGTPGTGVYRLILDDTPRSWLFAHDDCTNDSPSGVTHLVVFDDITELEVLRDATSLNFQGQSWNVWVGYARDTGSDPYTFFAVTGESVPYPSSWWHQDEPNNGAGIGEEETALWFADYGNLIDGPYRYPIPNWICECDLRMETRTFVLAP